MLRSVSKEVDNEMEGYHSFVGGKRYNLWTKEIGHVEMSFSGLEEEMI